MNNNSGIHWRSVAQEWKHFGSPLRPCIEDIQHMEYVVANSCDTQHNIKAKLCGVTPEIALMTWPAGTYLTAVEQSQEMIQEIWPGDITEKRIAIQGDWLSSLSSKHDNDVVIGDGCFISVNYPDGYTALSANLADSLKNNGILVMRFFIQQDVKEQSEHVISDLVNGKIGSFHAFKWRYAMSLQQSSQQGIRLHDIYTAWQQAAIDTNWLAEHTGWTREVVDTINLYENKQNKFSFATLPEIIETLSHYFQQESIYFPQYELGERCPIITFRSR